MKKYILKLKVTVQPHINKIFLIYFAILVFFCSCNKIKEEFDSSGVLRVEKEMLNDTIMNGIYKEYDEVGHIKYFFVYNNGLRDGIGVSYFQNGNFEVITNYRKGKKEGLQCEYYENGALKAMLSFKDNLPNGRCFLFDSRGWLKLKAFQKNGKFNGKVYKYDSLGRVNEELFYSKGIVLYQKNRNKFNTLVYTYKFNKILTDVIISTSDTIFKKNNFYDIKLEVASIKNNFVSRSYLNLTKKGRRGVINWYQKRNDSLYIFNPLDTGFFQLEFLVFDKDSTFFQRKMEITVR